MYCQKCGKENDNNSRFCQGCGCPLQQASTGSVEEESSFSEENSRQSYIEGRRRNNRKNIILAVLIPLVFFLILYVMYYFAILPMSNEISWMMGKKLSSVHFYHGVEKAEEELKDMYVNMGNCALLSTEDNGYINQMVIDCSGRYAIKGIKYGQSINDVLMKIDDQQDFHLVKEGETTFDATWGDFKVYRCEPEKNYLIIYYSDRIVKKILYCESALWKDAIEGQVDINRDDSAADTDSGEWSEDDYGSLDSYGESSDSGYGNYYDTDDSDSLYDAEDFYDSEDSEDGYAEEESGFYFPDSDTRKLTESDLSGLSKAELRIARNEIYARHGRKFQDSELQEYFDSCDWYYGCIDPENFDETRELNATERRNARFILKHE